jgi:hypothetical protein
MVESARATSSTHFHVGRHFQKSFSKLHYIKIFEFRLVLNLKVSNVEDQPCERVFGFCQQNSRTNTSFSCRYRSTFTTQKLCVHRERAGQAAAAAKPTCPKAAATGRKNRATLCRRVATIKRPLRGLFHVRRPHMLCAKANSYKSRGNPA